MPRGRQYYDPIVQAPSMIQGENDLSRVEVFQDEGLKWWGRQVAADGSLTGNKVGDFDHGNLLNVVREAWPTLPVYELRNEGDDSTWEGHGPSPRLWQGSSPETGASGAPLPEQPSGPSPDTGAGDEQLPSAGEVPLRLIPVSQPGAYVLLADICNLLEMWAVSYEVDKNPSGALALREAVDALKDVG